MNLTGQISFDFIVNEEVRQFRLNVIKNPRQLLLSIILIVFFLIPIFIRKNSTFTNKAMFSKIVAKETYWLYHELWSSLNVVRLADKKSI